LTDSLPPEDIESCTPTAPT